MKKHKILFFLVVLFLAIYTYNFLEEDGSIQEFQPNDEELPRLSDLSITINSPGENENFEADSPSFDLIISGSNISMTWYTLNYGPSYVINTTSGKINQTEWDSQYTGKVVISFFVNDTEGTFSQQEVKVWKCVSPFYFDYESIWGGSASEWVQDIACDSKRNVYLAGYTSSYGNGDEDFLLIKYDRFGTFQWYKTWGFSRQDWGRGVAVDSNDNIYIVGTGAYDICTVKYDSSGNEIWSRMWGGGNSEYGSDIAIDANDNIYVLGTTYTFGPGDGDMCLIKYDSYGNQIWNQTWGGSKKDYGIRLAMDEDENIFVGGHYGYEPSSASHWNIYLSKYNSTGHRLWTSTWGWSSRSETCLGMTMDSESNIYITTHQSRFDYNHLLKYNKSGSLVHEEQIARYHRSINVFMDSSDKLYVIFTSGYDALFWTYNSSCIKEREIRWWCPEEDSYAVLTGIPDGNFILATNREISTNNWDLLLTIFKDPSPISITIFAPKEDQAFDKVAPFYELMVTGEPYDKIWYSLDNGISKTFCNETGQINQSLWDARSSGIVEIMFYANDTLSNICQENVTVWKTNFPQIYSITPDFIVPNGTTGYTLSWFVYDNDGFANRCWIERNSVNIYEGSWSNNSNILYLENQYLRAGVYNYTCFVIDSYGAINYSSIFVTILNTAPSIVKNIENFTVNVGTSDFLFSWHAIDIDGNNHSYWIERNSVKIAEGMWDNNTDLTFIESEILDVGIYNYTCFVNDTALAVSYSSIILTIINHYPVITNNILNFTVDVGTTGFILSWHVSDIDGNNQSFWIERNSTKISEGMWNNNMDILFVESELLNAGVYNYTCFVNDTALAVNFSSIFVLVFNSEPVIVNITSSFTVNVGTMGYSLSWHVYDMEGNTDTYWIERNLVKIAEGVWSNDTDITFIEFELLIAGVYNYSCFINDTESQISNISIFVTIFNSEPVINNNISDFSVDAGTTGYSLSWHVYDMEGNTDAYWIERNFNRIALGVWNNDTDVTFIESEILNAGIYNYTCFINDTESVIRFSSIFVTVINTNPIVSNNTSDFTVNFGTIGYLLSWHAYDMEGNTDTYFIERNSVRIAEGTWSNNSDINYFESEYLDVGSYTYTCFVNDSFGLIGQSTISVKINSGPQYSGIMLPSINTYTQGADYVFNCTWFDVDGIISEIKIEFEKQNYTISDNFNGEYTYTFKDLSANESGYQFRWHAMDDNGAWNSTDWQSFILYKQVVQLLILFNGTQDNLIDSFNPILNITILNLNATPGYLQLFVEEQLEQQVEGYSLTNISQYFNGVYNITTILIDQNYTGYAMQWLNIQEITPPVIIFDYLNTTFPEYYHKSIRINCSVFDSSPVQWVFLCENSSGNYLNRSMLSLGNGSWAYEVDISHLNWNDGFDFYFLANDTWGNIGTNDNATHLYRVRIFDFQNPISTIFYVLHDDPNKINISTSFSIIADDIGSGVSLIRYRINNSNWILYTQPFNLSSFNPGSYEIFYYSVDNAGNVEEISSVIIVLINTEESPVQPAIPSFNLGILILIISITSLILLFKYKFRKKFFKPYNLCDIS